MDTRRTQARMLTPIALLLLLAISWGPVAECAVLPTCPIMATDAEQTHGCHPAGPAADDSGELPELTRSTCCGVSSQTVPKVALDLSTPSTTPLPVLTAVPIFMVVPVATTRSVSHRTPAPKISGRDLLSHHQAFLL